MRKYKQFIQDHAPTATAAIIHCRLATTGKKEDNKNNHPIYDKQDLVVHNGQITNHAEIRKYLQEKTEIRYDGEVDSEAILRLYEHTNSIEETYTHLQGSFAFILHEPNKIHATRFDNPVNAVYDPQNKRIVLSSETRFIIEATQTFETQLEIFKRITDEDKLYYKTLEEGEHLQITLNPFKIELKQLYETPYKKRRIKTDLTHKYEITYKRDYDYTEQTNKDLKQIFEQKPTEKITGVRFVNGKVEVEKRAGNITTYIELTQKQWEDQIKDQKAKKAQKKLEQKVVDVKEEDEDEETERYYQNLQDYLDGREVQDLYDRLD